MELYLTYINIFLFCYFISLSFFLFFVGGGGGGCMHLNSESLFEIFIHVPNSFVILIDRLFLRKLHICLKLSLSCKSFSRKYQSWF